MELLLDRGVAPDEVVAAGRKVEQALRASGVPFTILRTNGDAENYVQTVARARETGVVLAGAGDGRVASAPRDDYATATAAVLATDGHDGAVYELFGDTAWDFTQFAAALGTVLGRDVAYRPMGRQEHLAVLTGAGLDEGTAGFVIALDGDIRDGALDLVRRDLSRLAGRPTTPLVDQLRALA